MTDYFVCSKDCTYAGQRWYPGDKMPMSYVKGGECPKHFEAPADYAAKRAAEAEERHREEVRNRHADMRTDDPAIKKLTQQALNKSLGEPDAKVPTKPLGETWQEAQKGPGPPPVAGPQPGSEKRGSGRPKALDKILGDD